MSTQTLPESRIGAIAGAFVFLQSRSLWNRLRRSVQRLRQPRYLFGALVGGAYFYFFLFRRVRSGTHAATNAPLPLAHGAALKYEAFAAVALAVFVLYEWLFSGTRARLAFSEAEIAFLFPAPLTRTTLVHFNLLRSQFAIFFSAFLMTLFLRRGNALGASSLQYATGLWLVLSMLKLHGLAASFTRERLLDLGVRPMLRRTVVAGLVLLAALGCWWSMRAQLRWPTADELADGAALRDWFAGIAGTAPLAWLLAPFRWAVAPIFASDAADFARALLPAFALLVAHYLWVVRAQVSFEDASIAFAKRTAERLAAMREGRLRERKPTRPRSEPFRLAAHGFAPIAFLWKGLIAMGPFYRLRNWLIACVIAIAVCQWLAAAPERLPFLTALGVAIPIIGVWLLIVSPMMMLHGLRRTLDRMDILKATPLRGWQIALGELLTPAVTMSFASWLLLLIAAQAMDVAVAHGRIALSDLFAGAFGIGLVAPPLCALMLCVPLAGVLYFPAWTAPQDGGVRGIAATGQGLIFLGGYLIALVAALAPAALLGGLGYAITNWLADRPAALVAAALCACAALGFELACAVDLLGRRIDRFDVSQELR